MSEKQIQQKSASTFKKKIGNTTYTIKVHFNPKSNVCFKDKVKRLMVNDCLQSFENKIL